MLYNYSGGATMLPPGYIDNTTFIHQMNINFNQTWVTVARNTTWGTLQMDIVQRTGQTISHFLELKVIYFCL